MLTVFRNYFYKGLPIKKQKNKKRFLQMLIFFPFIFYSTKKIKILQISKIRIGVPFGKQTSL